MPSVDATDTPESKNKRNNSEMSNYSHTGSILNVSKEDDDSFDNSFGLFPKKRNFDRLKLENNSFL